MCSPKSDFSWPLSFAVAVFPGRQNEDSYVSVSCGELIFFLIKAGFVTAADSPRSGSFQQWLSNPWFSARQCCSSSFHPCIPLVCPHLEEDGFKTSQLPCVLIILISLRATRTTSKGDILKWSKICWGFAAGGLNTCPQPYKLLLESVAHWLLFHVCCRELVAASTAALC